MKKMEIEKLSYTLAALLVTAVIFGCVISVITAIGLTWALGQLKLLEIDFTIENVLAVALVLWAIIMARGGLNVETTKRT